MGISLIKLTGLIKAPIKWLYYLVVHQTKVIVISQEPNELEKKSLLIFAGNKGEGNLFFGISTSSKIPIEVIKIEVDYSAPLQLHDPKKMGFFKYAVSCDEMFPFRIFCEGSFQLNSKLISTFALTSQFPPNINEIPVRISVHARVRNISVGGYESYGRIQITKQNYRLVLSNTPLMGIAIPPLHNMTSPQPFLIQSAVYGTGETVNVLTHQISKDGTVKSNLFQSRPK